jgi:hypothetical protein
MFSRKPSDERCRNCDTNLNSNTPANRYQILKRIQNTVRVPSSIYTMNLAGLNVYQKPSDNYQIVDVAGTNYIVSPGVNWNQMSDRKEPHIQKVVTSSGSAYRGSSTKRTIVSSRPGAMSPGGSGVDIKHNSYDRYLNRIKGKAPLKRGVVPPYFASPFIPFNRAAPIYGGKIMKTSIVNGCNCPENSNNNEQIYKVTLSQNIGNVAKNRFYIGEYVYAKERQSENYKKARIITIYGTIFSVLFSNGVTENKRFKEIKKFDNGCECPGPALINEPTVVKLSDGQYVCVFPNNAFIQSLAEN